MDPSAIQSILDTLNFHRSCETSGMAGHEAKHEGALGEPSCRLTVYGSLAPGKSNHHHLADIAGEWSDGWVEGELHDQGWGAGMGFPGIVLCPGGPRVPVCVLESDDLPDHWERLDAFEGDQYMRLLVKVHRDDGNSVIANIYGLKDGGRD